MKKLGSSLIVSGLLASSLSAGTLADMNIEGLKSTNVVCEDTQVEGFELSIERAEISSGVFYSSCDGGEVQVVPVAASNEGEEGTSGEAEPVYYVTINGEPLFFPAGYTTPTVAANNSCTGGHDSTNGSIDCSRQGFSELSEGYLNLVYTGGNLSFSSNKLTNVDGLSNLTSVGNSLNLYNNKLTNVDGLSNLTTVEGSLSLSTNQLTNVDGLSNLTTVGGYLGLDNNQLTNVDGLSNLTSVVGRLYLHINPTLNDLSGLNNITSVPSISFDDRTYTVKMSASSWICQNYSSITTNTAKSNVCES